MQAVDPAALPSLPAGLFATAERRPTAPAQWKRTDGAYAPISYRTLSERVRHVASGLLREGFQPGDRIALLMENRPEWAVIDYAILSIGAVTVPLYCTYRASDMAYVLKDSGCVAAFTSGGKLLERLLQAAESCPDVRAIFTLEEAGDGELVRYLSELEAGQVDVAALDARLANLDRDTLATIVYTSGTTASPKGVMLSHGNILTNLEAVPDVIDLREDDSMLSFLPLAHALERMAGHFLVYTYGISVAFAERPDTVAKNLQEARPTILISVPRMLEVVRSRILAQGSKQPWPARAMFERYLSASLNRIHGRAGVTDRLWLPLLDRLVGRKIRARFGGRLRVIVSGGAPLAREVGEFFEALGLPVLEGYGLTESAPLLSVNPMRDRRLGTVGKAARGVELRIAPDGEILARGANIMLGYWHNDEATREAIDDEGWLHTGDVGEIDPDGYLTITDRKKDIIVNSGGENIAPQRIESLLVGDPMIDQAVVFGDQKPYLVALIAPNREAAVEWAVSEGLPETDWEHLVASKVLRKEIQNRINRLLAPLNPYEQVRRIHLLPEPFTIESGLLTPTMKVKRRKVYERFRETIEGLYAA